MQYTRLADKLAKQGLIPKALALYKKILKSNPGDEHAARKVAELGGAASRKPSARPQGTSHSRKGSRKGVEAASAREPASRRVHTLAQSEGEAPNPLDGSIDRHSVNVEEALARAVAEFDEGHHETAREVLQQLLLQEWQQEQVAPAAAAEAGQLG